MQIEVSGLHKSFLDGEGHQLHILKGLNFKLEAGASASIIGASGTGKSTFLHILGTLDEGDSGRICFENTDLMQMKDIKPLQQNNTQQEISFCVASDNQPSNPSSFSQMPAR